MKSSSGKGKMKMMMGDLMCQSPKSTAVVCMNVDPRSIIVPRRSTTSGRNNISSSSTHHDDHLARLINNTSRSSSLVGSRSYRSFNKIITTTTTSLGDDHKLPLQPINNTSSSPSSCSSSQVVVMRVSLHCQGCAGKVKKHLSKMEGVTSFSIDLETKRVTVIGNISPVGVLESISKVKRAEFWSHE